MKALAPVRTIVLAALLGSAISAAQAQSQGVVEDPQQDYAPSAAAMTFDLIIVRPLSLVATLLGSGLFLLQTPLALIQGTPPFDAAQKLVVEPARYTFDRPLGQME